MKKTALILTSLLVMGSISGCGNNASDTEATEQTQETATEAATGTDTENSSEEATEEDADTQAATDSDSTENENTTQENTNGEVETSADMLEAYYKVLEDICVEHVWPDGSALDSSLAEPTEEGNYYSLADVDGDGYEELVIRYENDSVAGMKLWVCGYNSEYGAVYTEMVEYPAAQFYDNGIVMVKWSHNMGDGPSDFWPYNMYQYNTQGGIYEFTYSVEAWDKSVAETSSDGTAFLDAVDEDGNGILYIVNQSGSHPYDNCIDDDEYAEWLASCIEGASEVRLDWVSLADYQSLKSE